MSWLEDKVRGVVLNRVVLKIAAYLKGKKTAIGALSFLLWVVIYAMPAFTPNYNWIIVYATMFRDALQAAGINLDNQLFNAGVGFTVVGLIDKVRTLFKKDNPNE
jgi:hypothetical protein